MYTESYIALNLHHVHHVHDFLRYQNQILLFIHSSYEYDRPFLKQTQEIQKNIPISS